jgi:hypothetical protein
MDARTHFIKQLKRLRKIEFYTLMFKSLFFFVLCLCLSIILIEKFQERDNSTALFLLISLIFFIGIAIMFLKGALEFNSIENSQIINCIEKPYLVTEIIINSKKIKFEIRGMEDETIFLKNSARKDEIIQSIILIFGKDKIVMNS